MHGNGYADNLSRSIIRPEWGLAISGERLSRDLSLNPAI
jgi:hypothetical protein